MDEAEAVMVKAHVSEFETCGEGCKAMTKRYVAKDRRYKRILFAALFIAAALVLAAALGRGMVFAYCAQFLAGLALALFPYPIANFATFRTHGIRPTTAITRTLGVLLVAWSIILWQFA